MHYKELVSAILKKRSYLCVGLDSDIRKIPKHFHKYDDPVLAFNKAIIEVTEPYAVSYKVNTAFYESRGLEGWKCLIDTSNSLPSNTLNIADAKRGDIGNTSRMYAEAFFKTMNFDALTVNPYMGIDSVEPFLEFEDKWVILLALTSNKGSSDFQRLKSNDLDLYQQVLEVSAKWASKEKLMYVVGATHPESFKVIRKHVPDHFLLVPGVGAQGGTVADVAQYGLNDNAGLLVNASRSIIYAADGPDFLNAVEEQAKLLRDQMDMSLKAYDE